MEALTQNHLSSLLHKFFPLIPTIEVLKSIIFPILSLSQSPDEAMTVQYLQIQKAHHNSPQEMHKTKAFTLFQKHHTFIIKINFLNILLIMISQEMNLFLILFLIIPASF